MTALGIDYGAVRIGVAREIPGTSLVVPIGAVAPADFNHSFATWITEFDVDIVYVGLPKSMSGAEGAAAIKVREWASTTAKTFPKQKWQLLDERLTTVAATKALHAAGKSAKQQREIVDSAAAVLILQSALEQEVRTARPVGESIE